MAKKKTTKKSKKTARKASPDVSFKRRATTLYRKLEVQYPHAECALVHDNAFELLIATILSAQCTDERVNKTTPALFKKYPDAKALAQSKPADVEKIIQSCGFYRNKTKSIRGAAMAIVDENDGNVPDTMDHLLELPGVARKTANVVLGNAFGINVGVVVDTHVKRLAFRMGLTEQTKPEKVEQDLMPLFPQKNWTMLSHLLIHHGRDTCQARKPDCKSCVVARQCPKVGVDEKYA